jgi:hypothetical protein
MKPYLSSLVLAAALALPASASAQVRYDFAGTFTTTDTTSSFALEGGFTGGTGNFSGFVEFDPADPGPTLFTATDAFLSIGSYTFDFADPLFSPVNASIAPPDFTLMFLSSEDFSAVNTLFEFLSVTISFPTLTSGLGQNPDPATGSVSINLAGESDALFGSGVVTQFDVTDAPAVPEPGAWMLMMVGFGMLGGALRLRKQRISQIA